MPVAAFLLYFFVFLFGLITGSFLNSVIYRLERSESFLLKRSYCPYCKKELAWYDLIPVLSFLLLKGRCRHCSQKISWQYPLVELSTGLVFLLVFTMSNNYTYVYLFYIVVSCFLIVIFIYDLKQYIIPDKVVYPAIALTLAYQIFSNFQSLITDFYPLLLSALGAAAFFLAIVLVSRGKWMGVGDIKLAFLMGLTLGWPNILVALFLAFFLGAIIGVGLIMAGRKKLRSEVPFGPFLVTGTFTALFWGRELVDWYLGLLI